MAEKLTKEESVAPGATNRSFTEEFNKQNPTDLQLMSQLFGKRNVNSQQ